MSYTATPETYTAVLDVDEYRLWTRAATEPTVANSTPDQWVDWGDHTVQVDPIGNKQWIHDSHDGHRNSEKRGRYYDDLEVKHLEGWEKVHQGAPPLYYSPTPSTINGMHKLVTILEPDMSSGWKLSGLLHKPTPHRWNGCMKYKGVSRDPTRIGRLPAISGLMYDNKLGENHKGDLDFEIRDSERTRAARLYSRDGWGGKQDVFFSPITMKHS